MSLASAVALDRTLGLKCAIPRFSSTADGSTFQYHIILELEGRTWEVVKRYSDFDKLWWILDDEGYGCLPRPPPKTIFTRLDVEAATKRQQGLVKFVHDLLVRPDLRHSVSVRDFLELDRPELGLFIGDVHQPHANGGGAQHQTSSAGSYGGNEFGGGDLTFDPATGSYVDPSAVGLGAGQAGYGMPQASLKPEVMRSFEDPRYAVSGILPLPHMNMIVAVHQDNSTMARLGRVWSIVEPDELGVIHCWTHSLDSGWERKEDYTCHQKPVCVCFDEISQKVFLGCNDGVIKVVVVLAEDQVAKPEEDVSSWLGKALGGGPVLPEQGSASTSTCRMRIADKLSAHHQASVIAMSLNGGKLLSIGYDCTMRIFDCMTHAMLGGGKFNKRVPEDVYPTSCYYDAETDRAIIGTSGFDVLVYGKVSSNPPEFLFHHKFAQVEVNLSMLTSHSNTNILPIPLDGRYTAGIARAGNTLAIAHSNVVSIFPFTGPKQENFMFERKIIDMSANQASHIVDLSAAPDRSILVAAFSNGDLAIWNFESPVPICAMRAHEGCTKSIWLDSTHLWGPALLSGGNEGKIHTWSFAADVFRDYHHWKPDSSVDEKPRIVGKSNFVSAGGTTSIIGGTGAEGIGGAGGTIGGAGGTSMLGGAGETGVAGTGPVMGGLPGQEEEQRSIVRMQDPMKEKLAALTLKQAGEEDSDDDLIGAF